jgi:hypothetical protein
MSLLGTKTFIPAVLLVALLVSGCPHENGGSGHARNHSSAVTQATLDSSNNPSPSSQPVAHVPEADGILLLSSGLILLLLFGAKRTRRHE